MSSLAQSHHASKRCTRHWAADRLLAMIRASSAYWSQLHCWCSRRAQRYPICLYPGDSKSLISELKQRWNRRGEQGSPCNTPLLTRILSVSCPEDDTVTLKLEYILSNTHIKAPGT